MRNPLQVISVQILCGTAHFFGKGENVPTQTFCFAKFFGDDHKKFAKDKEPEDYIDEEDNLTFTFRITGYEELTRKWILI